MMVDQSIHTSSENSNSSDKMSWACTLGLNIYLGSSWKSTWFASTKKSELSELFKAPRNSRFETISMDVLSDAGVYCFGDLRKCEI